MVPPLMMSPSSVSVAPLSIVMVASVLVSVSPLSVAVSTTSSVPSLVIAPPPMLTPLSSFTVSLTVMLPPAML